MSISSRAIFALVLVAFAAACAPKPEPVVEEVTTEPTYTGKL
jgi:hypothetical protein